MKSEPLDFLALIGGQKIFKIPVFQRIYSWENTQLEALWLDILSQYSKIQPHWNNAQYRDEYIKKIPKHYLGTMVMSGDGAVGIPKYEIIDGQQRITTIMTMIAALRDAKIKRIDKKDKDGIEKVRNTINNNYLINSYSGEDEKLRLILQKKDARAFKSLIENDSNKRLTRDSVGLSHDESDAVLKTYSYFLKQFTAEKKESDLDDDAKNVELDRFSQLFPLDLEILEQVIVRRLSFISILGSSEVEDLNAIFESLNFKGKDLKQLDLLKNYIFMLLGARADSAIQDYWSKIERALPDPSDQEFFVWACMVSEGKYEMQNRLYREIQTQLRIDGAATDYNVVIKYLDGLTRKVSHFTNFIECKHPNKEINEAFSRLKKSGDRISVPVVLWLYSLTSQNDFSEKDFVKGCKIIEAFLIRRFLAGQASNNLNSMFGRAVKNIFENKSSKSHLEKLTEALSEWCPTNESVLEGIKTSRFYKFGKPVQRIFILGSLDKWTDMQTMRNYEESDNSIEHIFPQTVNKDWDLAFASSKDEYESIKTTFCHTLGNLTIVKPGENSEVKNSIITEKLKKYERFEYSMTRKVPEFFKTLEPKSSKWGKPEIIARAELLGQMAIAIWPSLDKV